MLPTKYMDELKSAPEDKADFGASFAEVRTNESVVARHHR